jgi:hypothetical protein
MSHKISILISESEYTSFKSVWLEKIWQEYFDLILVEQDYNKTFDKKSTLIATNCKEVVTRNNWYQRFLDQGVGLIIDNLWEIRDTEFNLGPEYRTYTMENKNWFWYNESLWNRHLGHHNYQPNKEYDKVALVPMNLHKPHRESLRIALTPYANELIMSAGWNGQFLPGDLIDQTHGDWQRFFNPDWYNKTYFSIVTETTTFKGYRLFITEKTFKPMAFYHPFMVLGQIGVLAYLKSQGFETYENLFDESYDNIDNVSARINQIVEQVKKLKPGPYDTVTQQKIKHNHDRFFDKSLVISKITQEIINPILEFVNA